MAEENSEKQEHKLELRLEFTGLNWQEVKEIIWAFIVRVPTTRFEVRNPFHLDINAKTVIEVLVYIHKATAASYASKKMFDKAVDIFADVVKKKFEAGKEDHKKTVTIYGPDGEVASRIVAKPEPKPKKLKKSD